MNEKQFRKVMGFIQDTTYERGDVIGMMDLTEIEYLLNEQQSIIRKDEISIETMMSNMEKLEEENKQLKQEHKVVIDEMITNYKNLEKENEQLRQFINKGRRLSVKELMDNMNENELLRKENKELQTELDSFRPVLFHDMQRGTITLYTKGGIDE